MEISAITVDKFMEFLCINRELSYGPVIPSLKTVYKHQRQQNCSAVDLTSVPEMHLEIEEENCIPEALLQTVHIAVTHVQLHTHIPKYDKNTMNKKEKKMSPAGNWMEE